MRDCFDRLLIRPEALNASGRITCIRRAAGALLTPGQTVEVQWVGRTLLRWLDEGGNLARHLGVNPARGSKLTPSRLAAQQRHDEALLLLRHQLDSDRRVARILAGEEPCPDQHAELLAEVLRLGGGKSRSALTAARRRASSPMTQASAEQSGQSKTQISRGSS